VLSYVLFPQVAKKFFEDRLKGKTEVDTCHSGEEVHYITVTM